MAAARKDGLARSACSCDGKPIEAMRESVLRSLQIVTSASEQDVGDGQAVSPLLEPADNAQQVVLLNLQRVPESILPRKFALKVLDLSREFLALGKKSINCRLHGDPASEYQLPAQS